MKMHAFNAMALTVAVGIVATIAVAQADNVVADDAVVAAPIADQLDIIRIVDAIDAAVDAKDWSTARSFFADEVAVDFTSLIGGQPATIPADALIAGWSSNLTAEKTSFHLRGNHLLEFSAVDAAQVRSHGYAWNRMERGGLAKNGGDQLWEVWGDYAHGVVRTADGWRVNAMTFTMTAERGNAFVRDTPGE